MGVSYMSVIEIVDDPNKVMIKQIIYLPQVLYIVLTLIRNVFLTLALPIQIFLISISLLVHVLISHIL